MIIHAIGQTNVFRNSDGESSAETSPGLHKPKSSPLPASTTALCILTASAVATVYASSKSNAGFSLGLSYAVSLAVALLLVERALAEAQKLDQHGGSEVYATNGFLAQPDQQIASDDSVVWSLAQNVSTAAAAGSFAAALAMEGLGLGGMAYGGVMGQATDDQWGSGQAVATAAYGIGMVIVLIAMHGMLLIMVCLGPALKAQQRANSAPLAASTVPAQ